MVFNSHNLLIPAGNLSQAGPSMCPSGTQCRSCLLERGLMSEVAAALSPAGTSIKNQFRGLVGLLLYSYSTGLQGWESGTRAKTVRYGTEIGTDRNHTAKPNTRRKHYNNRVRKSSSPRMLISTATTAAGDSHHPQPPPPTPPENPAGHTLESRKEGLHIS